MWRRGCGGWRAREMDRQPRELVRGLAEEAWRAGEPLQIAPMRVLELLSDVELAEAERDLLVALWGGAISLRGLWRRIRGKG